MVDSDSVLVAFGVVVRRSMHKDSTHAMTYVVSVDSFSTLLMLACLIGPNYVSTDLKGQVNSGLSKVKD
jgi:hypothetical protein